LTPAQRWAIAAAILAVLTVGTWWFIRDDTGPRHEAALATPKEAPQAVPEVEPSPEAPSLAAAPPITREEKKATRLAKTTPKTNNDAEGVDSVIVTGYGTQTKSARVGAAARLADARIDTPVLI